MPTRYSHTKVKIDKDGRRVLKPTIYPRVPIRDSDIFTYPKYGDRLDIIAFKQKHPSSEYSTESTVSKISIDNVNAFYNNYFKPNNAFLVVIGDVDLENTISLVKKLFGNWNFSKNLSNVRVYFVPTFSIPTSWIFVWNAE